MKSRTFFAELKRRNVEKVAVVYALVSSILVQWRAHFTFQKALPPKAAVKTRITQFVTNCKSLQPTGVSL